MNYLHDLWLVLTHPSTWIQLYPYSQSWEDKLRYLLASHSFEWVDKYTAKLGSETVWIENAYYGSMHPCTPGNIPVRPRRSTIIKAHERLADDLIGERGP